ncbi:MAG: 1-acyl-sn-glycerol-3-phosphate acyltransferase [Planctomycetes bacterium]|nr:1-acyl-sn-glycerol-3-phosphate acyltransferase [Planctomycetota bacterium]
MPPWTYTPAPDLNLSLAERLTSFPRQPHLWMIVLRTLVALFLRAWLRVYHRFSIVGRERLPLGESFVLVANHQSHLDTLCLTAGIPMGSLHQAFPAAAADYFFSSVPSSAFTAVVINGLPFDRKVNGAESLAMCRRLLETPGNILILFPEGTRSESGDLSRFRSGIGRLVEGTNVPVIPCHLEGAFEALPKGARFPRPRKLTLRIGAERRFGDRPEGRETVAQICAELEQAVAALAPPKR